MAPTHTASIAWCPTKHLTVSLGPQDAGAGSVFQPVVFTNKGPGSCRLRGYPGVLGVRSDGSAVTAKHSPGRVRTVTLVKGGKASALVHASDVPVGGATACPPDVVALKITPPDNTVSVHAGVTLPSCGGLLVGAVVAGSTPVPT